MRIASLERSQLASARRVLAAACAFDRADLVAEEKLFGVGLQGVPIAIGAWVSSDELASMARDELASMTASGELASMTANDELASKASGETASIASTSVTSSSRTASTAARPFAEGADSHAGYGGEVLVGVAAIGANRIRVLAVVPDARRRGIGSALLAACQDTARAKGETSLRTLDEPGNYLAPGIDERNTETIAWLERRGWQRSGELRENIRIAVRGNPRVSQARLDSLISGCAARGYEVRRARADEHALLDAVASEFGGAWPFELARALEYTIPVARPADSMPSASRADSMPLPGVHVALRDGAYCGFAAHDGNNQGLGWFGPTGTWPAHRGNGLGEALLVACLLDVAATHDHCEVAWIGPRPFYDKVAGVASDRRFVLLTKSL